MAQLGMVGLGRMGANIVRRLMRDGHECVVYDVNPDAVAELAGEGADGAVLARGPGVEARRAARGLGDGPGRRDHREDGRTTSPPCSSRATRSSTAATPTTATTSAAPPSCGEQGIDYVDCGTSGGVFGLDRGYCLMIGGPDEAVERLDPIFATLAPGVESAERTPGRERRPDAGRERLPALRPERRRPLREDGPQRDRVRVMAAYAEGLNILKNANAGKVEREADAETAPLEQPEYYQYDLDIPEVAEVWRRGSVIGSWLLDLTAAALQESPDLADFAGRVSDSGEGRWTSIAAIDEGVPAPVLTTALYERFASRGLDDFADKVLSAMRKQFGGHDEKK